SSRASSPARSSPARGSSAVSVASLAGGSAVWPLRARRLPCGLGAGVMVEVERAGGRALVLVTGPVFSAPSPTDQKAQPLDAFSVIAVPAADGLLNSSSLPSTLYAMGRSPVASGFRTISAVYVLP